MKSKGKERRDNIFSSEPEKIRFFIKEGVNVIGCEEISLSSLVRLFQVVNENILFSDISFEELMKVVDAILSDLFVDTIYEIYGPDGERRAGLEEGLKGAFHGLSNTD